MTDAASNGLPYRIVQPLPLSRGTVDRSADRRVDDAWLQASWADAKTRAIVVKGGRTLVSSDALVMTSPGDAPVGEHYLLGVDSAGIAYYVVHATDPIDESRSATLREVGALLSDRDAGLLVHAVALANWHSSHRHCSRCGAMTLMAAAGHVRRCPVDGSEHYPRTDPAIIVLVVDPAERCLLGRNASWPAGRFSTLAGFVEPGESLEQAVAREVSEETGVQVTDVSYAGSQPWPFPSSLMLGFYARSNGGAVQVDGAEIVEARWFSRVDLRAALEARELRAPGPLSIAGRLIEGWFGEPLPETW